MANIFKKIGKIISNPKNIAAVALAPVTAGASLALLENENGKNIAQNLIGEITGANSAREQNEKNIEYMKEANAQNIAMQNETNAMTIDLANTAHQREVADLQKAGLNPVLSAGGTGAITPTLGTATVTAPQVQNELPGGYLAQAGQVANILNLAGTAKEAISQANLNTVNAKLQPELATAEISLKGAQAGSAKAKAMYDEVMTEVDKDLKSAQIKNLNTNTTKIDKETPYGGKTTNTISKYSNSARDIMRLLPFGKWMW